MSPVQVIAGLIIILLIVTIGFGFVSYILFKMRERKRKQQVELTYEDALKETGDEYLFIYKAKE
jgi:heme/copper-type cytochrome/quinol oxidase subunit 2